MPDMMTTSLIAAVACRIYMFSKDKTICYEMVYYTLCLGSANRRIVRNRVTNLLKTKNRLF